MSRRTIFALALACLALAAVAVAPWTVTTSGLTSSVARQLRSLYGLELTVRGRSTVAFLPVPRLKFEEVSLATLGTPPMVEAAQLRGEFRLLPLLVGKLELAELTIQ